MDVYIHVFFTSALVRGEWSGSRPDRFTPGEIAPDSHCIEGWVVPRTYLDDLEKRKFLTPLALQPVASRYTDWAISAPYLNP
jgi:hypothetical protein